MNNKQCLKYDISEPKRFLNLLDEGSEEFTFQTFDDKQFVIKTIGIDGKTVKEQKVLRKSPELARWSHGTIDDNFGWLSDYNKRGAGVFVMAQAGDGKGRNNNSVERIRCVFNENDGDIPKKMPLEPQIVVESSPGKSHYYFLCDGLKAEEFTQIESRLIEDYGSDKNAKDLARVLRLPGFYHNKGLPHKVAIIHESSSQAYDAEQIKSAFTPVINVHKKAVDYKAIYDVEVTDKLIDDIRSALKVIPSAEYSDWINNGMALKSLGDKGFILWMENSHKCEEKFDFQSCLEKWNTFHPHSIGYKSIFYKANSLTSKHDVKLQEQETQNNDEFDFSKFSLFGQTEEMRKKMLNDVFVLKDLAILGQATVFYAQFNTGKTLITLWLLAESIKEKRIKGKDVFYINADDTYNGLIIKNAFAEKYGFHMIAPNLNSFNANDFPLYLKEMITNGSCHGKIIILDTAKKFTDLMNKKVGSDFMTVARNFVQCGGTLIMLAHTNKHKGLDGKVVYGGTNDVASDSDCVFTVDTVSSDDKTKVVVFEQIKSRGNVAREVSFSYNVDCENYAELMKSVRLNNSSSTAKDAKAIDAITAVLSDRDFLKTDLVNAVSDDFDLTKREIISVLEKYTGKLWVESKNMAKNRKFFSLI